MWPMPFLGTGTQLTVASVNGNSITDNKPLAQEPLLEGRLSVQYDDHIFSFGTLWRHVAGQDRYDIGSGNIVMTGWDVCRVVKFSR